MMTITQIQTNTILPEWECAIIHEVAEEYKATPYEICLAVAIRKAENGSPGRYFGVGSDIPNHPASRYKDDPDKTKNYRIQTQWTFGTIVKRFRPGNDLEGFSIRWCYKNHLVWLKNVTFWLDKMKQSLDAADTK